MKPSEAIGWLYADLVIAGLRSLVKNDDGIIVVPERYMDVTVAELTERGYFDKQENK